MKLTKLTKKIEKYFQDWKYYHWIAFILINMVIAFQFTAESLFMDLWQMQVELGQIALYLLAVIGNGLILLIIFFGIDALTGKIAEKRAAKKRVSDKKRLPMKVWLLCVSLCVFAVCSVLAYKLLPDFWAPSYAPTEVTVTLLEDKNPDAAGREVLLSKNAIIDGASARMTPVDISGSWNTEYGYFWGLAPGSSITFSFPAAEDIDLRFNKHRWSGIVEIEDGAHKERLDLYSDISDDYLESYRVKSNIIPSLSKVETALIAAFIGILFAGIFGLLVYTTWMPTSSKLYQLSLFLSVFSIWLVYLCAGNPGGISIDTLNQFAQAKGEIPMNDAHPALLTIYYRGVFQLTDHPVVFSLLQMAFFAFVVAMFLRYLSLHGLSRKLLSVFAVLFSAHIVNGIYASVLWKDVPYTVCLLWLTLLLTKLAVEKREFFSVGNMIQLVVCVPLTVLLRHNGIVVFLLIGIVLIGFTVVYRSWKPAIMLLLGVLIFGGIKGPVYTSFGVTPSDIYTAYGLIHGMAYTRIASEESDDFMDTLMFIGDWMDVYEPYCTNSFGFSEVAIREDLNRKINDLGADKVNQEYIKTFLRHPFLIIKDRLLGSNLLWNSVPSGYNWRITNNQYLVVVDGNSFGYYCRENFLTDALNKIYLKSIRSPWSDMLIWRAGPYISLSLILLFLSFKKKKYGFFLAAIPLLGNSLSLLLAMTCQDYRYVYFAMVCTCFLALAYFICPVETKDQNGLAKQKFRVPGGNVQSE